MATSKYNLGFISDENIYKHVKDTVLHYKSMIDLEEFNSNIIDPVKLTFDAKVYGKTFEELIESECIRQADKANNNQIGYFHQNLFLYAGNGWYVPKEVFDVANDNLRIYVEIKNKHNTMNSSSSKSTYIKMQNQLLKDPQSTCMLVEVIAKTSQNIVWKTSIDKTKVEHPKIRRVSIDKFYEIVFSDNNAFAKLCNALPLILDDVIKQVHTKAISSNVSQELKKLSTNTFKSLYLLAFDKYEGFNNF